MLFKLSLFLHVLAAIFWVGGMLFLTIVIAPFLKTVKDQKGFSLIYQELGTRYRFWGWIAIVTLLITGPLNLYVMGVSPLIIFDPSFHGTSYGRTLITKLSLVFIIVVASLLHDFWLGPKARYSPRYSMIARALGRSNLVIALLIVVFAIFLRAGGV